MNHRSNRVLRGNQGRVMAGVVGLALIALIGPMNVASATTPPVASRFLASWMATHGVTTYSETSSQLTYAGRWSTAVNSGYLGGRARASTQRNASATIRFTGTGVAWIGPVGPTRGAARVYLNGRLIRTVNTYSSRFSPARALFSMTFGSSATRTLKIVVAGTAGHPAVAVDTIAVRTGLKRGPSPTPTPAPSATCTRTAPAATGSNQTSALQAWIDGAPNGATLCFRPGGVYRSDGILTLNGRRNLTFLGQGATLYATETSTRNRRNWWLNDSTGITFRDMTVKGANSNPGEFNDGQQHEHGFWIDGGGDIEIDDVTLLNQYGDGIYLGDRDGSLDWTDGIHVHDLTISGSGRNCIAIVAARNVIVERVTLANCGLHAFDIEPNVADGGADRVTWRNSTVRAPIEDYVFASNGKAGTMTNIRVEGIKAVGKEFRTTVQAPSGYRFARIAIIGNSSDTAADGPVMRFRAIDGLTVTGNSQPLDDGELTSVSDSTSVVISGN